MQMKYFHENESGHRLLFRNLLGGLAAIPVMLVTALLFFIADMQVETLFQGYSEISIARIKNVLNLLGVVCIIVFTWKTHRFVSGKFKKKD